MSLPPVFAASALYDSLLQAALRQFFGRATFETEPIPSLSSDGRLAIEPTNDPSVLTVRWFGSRYVLHVPARRPFTPHEVRLARAIGAVLAARYRAIFDPKQMLERGELFRGAIEDRYVGAFLDALASGDPGPAARRSDRHRDRGAARRGAVELREPRDLVRRAAARQGRGPRAGVRAASTDQAYRYSQALTGIKSFYRLCDGIETLFLVNATASCSTSSRSPATREPVPLEVPVPDALPRRTRSRPPATPTSASCSARRTRSRCSREGVQMFSFRNARWHLLDHARRSTRCGRAAVGNPRAGRAAVPDGARSRGRAAGRAVRRAARSAQRRCRSSCRPADQLDAPRGTPAATRRPAGR